MARIKLMKNKKGVQMNQMKNDLAQLLQSGQDRTARIRVCSSHPSILIYVYMFMIMLIIDLYRLVCVCNCELFVFLRI